MVRKIRIGFVLDGLVPGLRKCLRVQGIRTLFSGWPSNTAMGIMRFGWIARWVNSCVNGHEKIVYELYRPWRRYHLVVFLKSFDESAIALRDALAEKGVKTLFDLNVDYLQTAEGKFYYDGMAPSPAQNRSARYMATVCDGVIADSYYLAALAFTYNDRVECIPDNVRDDLIADGSTWRPSPREKLPLLWCGQHVKLFELLQIQDVLISLSGKVRLRLITNGSGSHPAWSEKCKKGLDQLLDRVEHEFLPFHSVENLMQEYDHGGVFIAPRYLDNTYNLGHTEWKIALPMARGRFILCSPLPSYLELAEKAGNRGVWVCRDEMDWRKALEQVMLGSLDWSGEQSAATDVVRRWYSTSVVAARHLHFVEKILHG